MAPAYDDETEEEEEDEVEAQEEDDDEEDEEEEDEPPPPPPPPKRSSTKKWKDPTKPKRAMSAFFIYSQGNRARIKEENPEATFGDIARILSRQYKELPEKESRKWEKKAEQDKIRYQEEMKSWVPMAEPGEGRPKKAKKDPNAPKRNMSAYFLYSISARSSVKEENPEASFGDIARIISSQFKALSEEEVAEWKVKAASDKVRYEREMQAYKG